MKTLEIVGLVVGILVAVFCAVALYYLIRFLLKPKLHLPEYDDIPRSLTVGVKNFSMPRSYLRSTFIMYNFEQETVDNIISMVRDLRFQLSSVYCYRDLLRNLEGCEEKSDEGIIVQQKIKSCDSMASSFSCEIQKALEAALEESESSVVASSNTCNSVVLFYKQLHELGREIKECVSDIFSEVYDTQAHVAYNLTIESIMTECERKLFIFDGARGVRKCLGSSSLGPVSK
ncbi:MULTISPECIES: hypothetical protein [Ehrlichia]|uniref:Uncharacterized protein n=1 Tax=Ehrlichia cf. muris str. EmCRT TaxID=1359167 RepID=A0A0F3NFC2_9RICK|nr:MULTISPECIES: hypothetical protein [Ehrlichia]KJV65584.1 hypothetical protein EMUCRT_0529 [Ehrlichia cf. muris str. EmCRT]OUC04458.1 hypothetical protein DB91_02710 [Ehrlichia sp. Wisconsin_h]